jgi:purine-binding chemotaxis protein CheW
VNTHVSLRVGVELYAVPVEHVLEVAELGDVTPVPGAPPAVLGVWNLRGQILPVLDLGGLLGLARSIEPRRLVVVEAAGRRAGLAVDEVRDVAVLPGSTEETESELLAGATLTEDGLVGVVDVLRLFGVLERAAA